MKKKKLKLAAGKGKVSAEIYEPDKMKALYVFAHGAGAGMGHPFMTQLSAFLAERNIGTLRFNFPFTEEKKGRPDVPAVAHATIAAAINKAVSLFPGTPILAGGKSFGGRMTSQWASKNDTTGVTGLVFVGFPLHAPGNPSTERADHLKEVKVPMLFLQGTRDALADWQLVTGVCKKLKLATLFKFENADHSFKVPGRKDTLEVLAQEIDRWFNSLR